MVSTSSESVMNESLGAMVVVLLHTRGASAPSPEKHQSGDPLDPTTPGSIALSIPLSLLKQREIEMRQTASRLGIPKERWNGSLIHQEWERHTSDSPEISERHDVSIALSPDTERTFEWPTEWMQTLLTQFYTAGTVSIPSVARGHEIVSLLDWLQIVYAPDQCQFADYAVYQRVQQWSRYLCHRSSMVAHIVRRVHESERNSLAFVTVDMDAQPDHGLALLDGSESVVCTTLGQGDEALMKMAYKLFNAAIAATDETDDEVTLPGPEECTAAEMRLDFTTHVARLLSDSTVTFAARSVTTGNDPGTRAVLMVAAAHGVEQAVPPVNVPPRALRHTSSELNVPVDELVEEELLLSKSVVLHPGESRTVSKDTSMETLTTTAPCTPQSTSSEHESSPLALPLASCSSYVNLADQLKVTSDSTASGQSWRVASHDDYNAPHDELNASIELNASTELNASIYTGIVSARSSFEAVNLPKKKRKPKPVFELPEKLLSEESFVRGLLPSTPTKPLHVVPLGLNDNSLLPAPITIVRTGTYDNTVTSALTGPFYIDDNGNLRDVFEHSPDADKNDDDDDTRAQARRHEWIQTALLNRGIGERMETLLKEPEETSPALTSMDPWEWFTGLGVCEFSRAFMKSVEEYASGIGVDLRRDPDQTSPAAPANEQTKGTTVAAIPAPAVEGTDEVGPSEVVKTHPTLLSMDNRDVRNPSTVKDRLQIVQSTLHDDQAREDLMHHGDCNIELVDQNESLEECSSQGSKDSPRGVQTFDTMITHTVKFSNSVNVASEAAKEDGERATPAVTHAETVTRRKNRGIKALFRRRKVDT